MLLGQPDNVLIAGMDVGTHGGLGGVGLSGQDTACDHLVVTVRTGHGIVREAAGQLQAVEGKANTIEGLLDVPVAGYPADGGVVGKVLRIVPVDVIACLGVVETVLVGPEQITIGPIQLLLGREACGEPLKHLPNPAHFEDLGSREAPDIDAPVLDELEVSFADKSLEDLADPATTDGELLRQIDLNKTLARRVASPLNPTLDTFADCRRRNGFGHLGAVPGARQLPFTRTSAAYIGTGARRCQIRRRFGRQFC